MTYEDTPRREFKGIWIPAEIWEDDSLSVNEKILYLEIDSFTSQNKSCFISNEHISKLLHISENASSKVLNSLVKKGLVVVTKFDGRKRYIQTVAKQTRQKAKAESPNEQSCIGDNSTYNIQDNNTEHHNFTSTDVDVPQSGGKEKKYTITYRCRLVFEREYLQKKGNDYYFAAKDAAAIKQLIGKIRKFMPDEDKNNDDVLEYNFTAFIQAILNSGKVEKWVLDNLSLPVINSKFNEIYAQLKNGTSRQQPNNGSDPNCRISRDFIEETMREAGLM